MKCKLCNTQINNYDSTFHQLKIDDNTNVDICPDCIDKIKKWQSSIYAKLFPTKTMKKIHEKK
jgi:hypothetical protein